MMLPLMLIAGLAGLPSEFLGTWEGEGTRMVVANKTLAVVQADVEVLVRFAVLAEFDGQYFLESSNFKGMKYKIWREGPVLKTKTQLPGWKPGMAQSPVMTYSRKAEPKENAGWAEKAAWRLEAMFRDNARRQELAKVVANVLTGGPVDDFENWIVRRRKRRVRVSFIVRGAPAVVWEFNRQGHIKSEFVSDGLAPNKRLDTWLRTEFLPKLVDTIGD